MLAPLPASAITALIDGLKPAIALASSIVTSGRVCQARRSSSSSVMNPTFSILNEPMPMSLMMASETYEFMPWINDTTAMIDVTATMLPSTIISERILLAQIELSARRIASTI